jgi:hypothetical protein
MASHIQPTVYWRRVTLIKDIILHIRHAFIVIPIREIVEITAEVIAAALVEATRIY